MKLKLAIIFGIVIWVLSYVLSSALGPIFTDNLPYIDLIKPLTIIVVTGFFGILYIRNIETNEVVEGILAGMIFVIVHIFIDMALFVVPNTPNMIIHDFPTHVISVTILTILITTFLGYLAQMKIDLK